LRSIALASFGSQFAPRWYTRAPTPGARVVAVARERSLLCGTKWTSATRRGYTGAHEISRDERPAGTLGVRWVSRRRCKLACRCWRGARRCAVGSDVGCGEGAEQ